MTGFINIDGRSSYIVGQSFWFWFSDEDSVGNMAIALMTPMMMMIMVMIIMMMMEVVLDIGFFEENSYWVECEAPCTTTPSRLLRICNSNSKVKLI